MLSKGRALVLVAVGLAACGRAPAPKPHFPAADRPVAPVVSPRWSTEADRDRAGEAERVMDLGGVRRGMTVADIGAGEGYYTIRLSKRVGPDGRVLAEDIVAAVRDTLARRVDHDRLDNVSVTLGAPDDPNLPDGSFDRVLMIHMYHEIESPYAFLWNLRPALKPGTGRVIVVDADRPTNAHGTPPKLLACEFAAVGYRQVAERALPANGAYIALFEVAGERPAPEAIKPCRADGTVAG